VIWGIFLPKFFVPAGSLVEDPGLPDSQHLMDETNKPGNRIWLQTNAEYPCASAPARTWFLGLQWK